MGSLFRTPKAPTPMDVGAVTARASGQNTSDAYKSAAFNRIGQRDRFGNTLNYSQTGVDAQGNPTFEASQGLGEMGEQYAGGLARLGQNYFDRAGQGMPDSSGAFNQAYDLASANLEPRFQRATDQMENKLRNQGLDPTSEAYKSSSNDLALQQNEARNNLVSSLQGQMFNQSMASRQQGMNELNPGIQFGNSVLGNGFVNPTNVNTGNVDVAGLEQAKYNQEQQVYQQQMQQKNAMMGGLAGIGSSLLMAPMTGGMSLGGMMGQGLMGGVSSMFGGGQPDFGAVGLSQVGPGGPPPLSLLGRRQIALGSQ